MNLNRQQQQNLFNKINKNELGGSSVVNATIYIQLDNKTIACETVKLVNDGINFRIKNKLNKLFVL